jgi:hypothetical protein
MTCRRDTQSTATAIGVESRRTRLGCRAVHVQLNPTVFRSFEADGMPKSLRSRSSSEYQFQHVIARLRLKRPRDYSWWRKSGSGGIVLPRHHEHISSFTTEGLCVPQLQGQVAVQRSPGGA